MHTSSIILEGVSRDEFDKLVHKVNQLSSQTPKTQAPDEYKTRHETAKKLRISLPTLGELTKKGKLKGYHIGGRVLYKDSDIEASLRPINSATYRT
jgi:excisionase family DNA binding protein